MPREDHHDFQVTNNPFKRGIMNFEDYNYSHHNPYILVKKAERG